MRDWKITDDGMKRSIAFQSFTELSKFLGLLAPIADKQDHHPDCVIRKAVIIDITLITHDTNFITVKDGLLAGEINEILHGFNWSAA